MTGHNEADAKTTRLCSMAVICTVFLSLFCFSYPSLLSAVIVTQTNAEMKIRAPTVFASARIVNYSMAGTKNSEVKAPSSLLYFTQPPCSSRIASARRRPKP